MKRRLSTEEKPLKRYLRAFVKNARKLSIPKKVIEEFLRSQIPKWIEPNNLTAEQIEGIVSDVIATF
jgi:hypothetical protein